MLSAAVWAIDYTSGYSKLRENDGDSGSESTAGLHNTGLASAKFGVPGSPTRRFRLVYAEIDATTRGIIAVGLREEHAIYRLAVQRLRDSEPADDQ